MNKARRAAAAKLWHSPAHIAAITSISSPKEKKKKATKLWHS
jgi:hypothetical protein